MFTPEFHLALGPSSARVPVGHAYVGLAFLPRLQRWATRLSIGVNLELRPPIHDREHGAHLEIVPTMHLGVSWLRPPPGHPSKRARRSKTDRFMRAWLTRMNVYAILGTRLPRSDRHAAVRMGIGITSPWLLVFAASNTRGRAAFVPNLLEATADIDVTDGTPRFLLKLGWGM